jgi:hypothetical protein
MVVCSERLARIFHEACYCERRSWRFFGPKNYFPTGRYLDTIPPGKYFFEFALRARKITILGALATQFHEKCGLAAFLMPRFTHNFCHHAEVRIGPRSFQLRRPNEKALTCIGTILLNPTCLYVIVASPLRLGSSAISCIWPRGRSP